MLPLARKVSWSTSSQQRLEHDVRIDIALAGMPERAGQGPDNAKAEALPQPHRSAIRAYHEVELHAPVTQPARLEERVTAQRGTDTAAARLRMRHVPGVGDVVAQAGLRRAQQVRP